MTDDRHVVARIEPCEVEDFGTPYCVANDRCHGCQGDGTRLVPVATVAKRSIQTPSRYSHVPYTQTVWKEVPDE